MQEIIRKELRVAFSPRAQPIWFRLLKWPIFFGVTWWLWQSDYFWWWIGGMSLASFTVHFTWRYKTRGWTRPWGGWSDVAAGQRRARKSPPEDVENF